ncbi:Collagen triple helix repeat-containing protein [Streptococcus gallolyticus]|uniref:Collagen triple helix repeat-containing protein n=1 Tax=Streptococcus gallolyticus TaxID=315405 RepID=A0A1I7JH86_9STRE|nr:hypothetical protein [Streptococcus gallolyticus]SFC83380.1 Collagen triple helix repeat-containing protein [Streptococcus gallolyticus]SFU84508.1 Collagen triple helix repeat-containing protein [Streptococcus gallolyticus]
MLLTLHDANLNKVAFIDNDKSGTLNYFDDTWTRDLETGSSTFEFSIYKKSLKSDTAYKKAYNYLNERAFVSFVYKGQTYLFNVMTVEEDETTIQCYCENLNLELINEYANPYKAEKAMSFVEYCNAMDLLNMTKLTVGRNEISDYRRTLEWEGQDTKLARLLSLANKFDAEIDFETILNDDSTLKSFKVNVYHENDDTHQGVGRVRSDIRLTYGKNLKSITRKVDKTGIFNMIVPTSSSAVDDEPVNTGESSAKTVTTTNADGSITKTTTKKASDGTTVQTKVTTKVVEKSDGSKVTTVRTEKSDGSITEKVTTKSANGNTDTVTKTIREATKENVETVDEYITIAGLPDWEIKNDEGVVEFYKKGEALYAPISARLYPSTFTTETQSDQWIRHDMSFDVDSDTKLETEALKQLKANAYPALTYTIKGYIDADIGDTLSMSDSGFVPTLLLTARVSNQKLSFTQPSKNETTLANFKALESGLTDDIQSRLEELIESSKPYTIRVASTNGTTFKNNTGESTVTATLLKGDKTVSADVTWRWALDGNITVASQYLVKAENIQDTAVLTVSAYIGNNEVAVTEVDLTNVNDGLSGSKGDDGVGIDRVSNYYLATAQLNSIEPLGDNLLVNADTFNDWISVSGGDGTATVIDIDNAPLEEVTKAIRVVDNTTGNKDLRHKNALNLVVGEQYTISCFARVASDSPKSSVTLLMRSWTTNDTNRKLSTAISHTDWQFYSFTFTADVVSNTIQFGQSGAGIIEICAPRLVKNQKSYGWTSLTQTITESSRYLWHYRVEHYTDNTEKATAPMIIGVYGNRGESGKDGVAGKDGVGIKSSAVTYALGTSSTTAPTSGWSDQVPTLTKGKYLWTKTVWTYTDNTSETGYQATYIAKDGNDGNDGIAGKDGVGIKSTTITYASSTSGTTKPTSGWSGTIPSVSAGKYLWTKTVWMYTDNTSETGYSVAKMGETGAKGDKGDKGDTGPQGIQGLQGPKGDQGIQGDKGADGKTQYTHIAYADNATGGGFSQTDQTKAYIGMYQDFTATDSTDPTKYRWTKWKGSDGAQGIPGKAGADGKTPYIHFAYASSADGKTGFSLTDGNQRYMGYYSDYTEADSSDYTKYKWVDRLANVQVGNKNLILKSNDFANPHKQSGANTTVTSTDDYFVIKSTGYTANAWGGMSWNMSISEVTAGEEFSILMPVYIDSSVVLDNGWNFNLKNHPSNSTAYNYSIPVTKKDEWFNVAITFKTTKDVVFDTYPFYVYLVKNGLVRIKPPILVRGNIIPSDYVVAPEDTQAQIDSKADSVLTQEQLNALAEKNRTLEAELEAKAALATVEAWKEAYDNYVSQNETDKAVSEANLVTATNRITALAEDWQDKKVSWSFLDTHMDFQNEGLILGKKGSPTTIRISNDRIAFYSGGTEVASMSEGTLTIDNGIFAKSLQIGHFREEVYESDSSINVIRWVD